MEAWQVIGIVVVGILVGIVGTVSGFRQGEKVGRRKLFDQGFIKHPGKEGENVWGLYRIKDDGRWVEKGEYTTNGEGSWLDQHREVIDQAIRRREVTHNGRYAVVWLIAKSGKYPLAEGLGKYSAFYTLEVPNLPDTAVKPGFHDLPELAPDKR